MSLIAWSPQYSVDIPELDHQHHRLIDLVNDLHDAVIQGHARDVLAPILDNLMQYTVQHFAAEEKIMLQKGFPYLTSHKSEHARLTQTALQFKQKFDAGETAITVQLLAFLKQWLVNHICMTDRLYSPFLTR